MIRQVLVEKCASKRVPVPTFAALESSPHRAELENEWGNMLAHQLQELPPFESFWEELPALFDWLEGRLVREELESAPQEGEAQPMSLGLRPRQSGPGAKVSRLSHFVSLRANHLCVDLGYGDSVRRIEPYAFRRTKVGKALLCAVKVQTRESRTYRLDRIQSIQVTNQPFDRRSVSRLQGVDISLSRNWREEHPHSRFAAVSTFRGPKMVNTS